MTTPTPSQVRVVRLYSGAQMLSTRGVTPTVPLQWPSKHPLDSDWWWIDATGWCQDIGDIISSFTTADVAITCGDGALSALATAISSDGYQVGIRFIGGTSGQRYGITVSLTGSLGIDSDSFDVAFPCRGNLPAGLSTPWFADFSNPDNSAAYYYL
jgi:hypothetical protein